MTKFGRAAKGVGVTILLIFGRVICLAFEAVTMVLVAVWPSKRLTAEEANAEGPRDYLVRK